MQIENILQMQVEKTYVVRVKKGNTTDIISRPIHQKKHFPVACPHFCLCSKTIYTPCTSNIKIITHVLHLQKNQFAIQKTNTWLELQTKRTSGMLNIN